MKSYFYECLHIFNKHAIKWIIFTIILFFHSISANVLFSNTTRINCTSVFQIFENRGVDSEFIPRQPVNEIVLRYCELSSDGSCCAYNTETKLASISRTQFEKNIKESIGKLHSILGTRAQKFNEFFTQLLVESKKEFHAMFKRTYGIIYEQNAYVFSDFFSELEAYFARGKIDLTEAMDSFFNTLYQKLFTVLNAQYTFDDKYLGCISEHMKELKPFGDVPDKLSVQIKRSFVATRTYAQALNTAADVAKNMINIRPTAECTASLTKMQQCGLCRGFTEKPCANYCVSVVKGCLLYYNDLDIEWENFISSMEKVSERLLGPFNIVMVVEPINIKISEAIMNFQETGQEITKQVFQGCGRPILGLQKRHAQQMIVKSQQQNNITNNENFKNDDINYDNVTSPITTPQNQKDDQIVDDVSKYKDIEQDFMNTQSDTKQQRKKSNKKNRNKGTSDNVDDVNKEPILDKLVKDIRQKVKDSKKFWSNLPYQICNNEDMAISPGSNGYCWNGNKITSINGSIPASQGFQSTISIGSTSRQTAMVGNQLYYLKTAINHLRNAYNGQDVEWTDQEESYYGSGSGSGNGIENEEESSSGLGSLENIQPHLTEQSSVRTHINNGSNIVNTTDFKHSTKNINEDNIPKQNNASSTKQTKVSLRQTLFTYLLPICVAWFGGIVSDLL